MVKGRYVIVQDGWRCVFWCTEGQIISSFLKHDVGKKLRSLWNKYLPSKSEKKMEKSAFARLDSRTTSTLSPALDLATTRPTKPRRKLARNDNIDSPEQP
jgi:hypothetical protein